MKRWLHFCHRSQMEEWVVGGSKREVAMAVC